MEGISLLVPPIAFVIVLIAALLLSWGMTKLSLRPGGRYKGLDPYACGEDIPTHLIQPDYGQFFPFAFFFTILHVVALMVATIPTETMTSFAIALLYILGAAVGLSVLYRRWVP
jgi:NADH-quinone oxidoreductase subunit A